MRPLARWRELSGRARAGTAAAAAAAVVALALLAGGGDDGGGEEPRPLAGAGERPGEQGALGSSAEAETAPAAPGSRPRREGGERSEDGRAERGRSRGGRAGDGGGSARGRDGDRGERRRGGSRRRGGRRRGGRGGGGGGRGGVGGGGGAGSAALAVTAPGTHRYTTSGSETTAGRTRRYPATTTWAVRPADGDRQTTLRDLRSGSEGTTTEMTRVWGGDAVALEEIAIRSSFSGVNRETRLRATGTAHLLPRTPAAGWSSTFDLRGDGTTAHVELRIVRIDTVASRRAFLLSSTTRFEGRMRGVNSSEAWLSTDDATLLREQVSFDLSVDAPVGRVTSRGSYESTLQ